MNVVMELKTNKRMQIPCKQNKFKHCRECIDYKSEIRYCINYTGIQNFFLNRQHNSIRKYPYFVVYTTASSEEPPSATSELRESAQPAKPVLPIRLFYKELPKVYVFSAHKMFTAFCARFPNRISHFKILAMP